MRVFAALGVPGGVLDALAVQLPAPPPQLRPIPRRRWHLTLAFYGEVDDPGLACLGERLERRLARWEGPAPRLRIDGGGAFRAGAVYLAAVGEQAGDDGRMRQLAEICIRTGLACAAPGTEVARAAEHVRFRAHITVSRSRGRRRPPPEYIAALQPVFSPPWEPSHVQLIASFLGSEPRYETLRAFPLRPTGGQG